MRIFRHICRQFRHDAAWMDRKGQHALCAILRHDELREPAHGELSRLVPACTRPLAMRSHAAQVHNRFVAALEHQRQQRPRHQIRTPHIHGPRLPPLVRVAIHNRHEYLQVACVVNKDVQAPVEVARYVRRHGFNGLPGRDVHLVAEDFGWRVPGGGGGGGEFGLKGGERGARGESKHGSARAGVGKGGGAADAFAGAGDEDMFAVQGEGGG